MFLWSRLYITDTVLDSYTKPVTKIEILSTFQRRHDEHTMTNSKFNTKYSNRVKSVRRQSARLTTLVDWGCRALEWSDLQLFRGKCVYQLEKKKRLRVQRKCIYSDGRISRDWSVQTALSARTLARWTLLSSTKEVLTRNMRLILFFLTRLPFLFLLLSASSSA